MAEDNLTWVFTLVDRMSATADKMEASLKKVSSATEKTGKGVHEAEGFFQKFGEKVAEANEHAASNAIDGLAEKFIGIEAAFKAAEAVGELVEKLVDLGVELVADTLKAATFEQKLDIVFGAITGSSKATEEATDSIKRFSIESGMAIDTVAKGYQRLMLAGNGVDDTVKLLQASTDVGIITGQGQGGTDRMLELFTRIQSMGKLTAREFMELRGALPVAHFDQLAKVLGFTASEGGRFKGSAVEGHKAIQAILDTIAKSENGKIGNVTKEMGKTLPGLFQTAKNSWDIILGSVEKTDGFKNLVTTVSKFVDLLDPEGPTGKKIIDVFDRAAVAVGEFLEPFTQPGVAEDFFQMIEDDVNDLISVLKTAAKLMAFVVNPAGAVSDLISDNSEALGGAAEKTVAMGNATGAVAGLPGLGSLALSALSSVIPGFADGARVTGPTFAMLGEGGEPETVVPDSKRGAMGGMNVQLQQHFTINTDSSAHAEQVGHAIHKLGIGEFQSAFDSLALQMGTA